MKIAGIGARVKVASGQRDSGHCRKSDRERAISSQNNFGVQRVGGEASQSTHFPGDEALEGIIDHQVMSGDMDRQCRHGFLFLADQSQSFVPNSERCELVRFLTNSQNCSRLTKESGSPFSQGATAGAISMGPKVVMT
jgi:hypothetical protein